MGSVGKPVYVIGSAESVGNISTTPLSANATFTGQAEKNLHRDAMIVCKTDAAGTLYSDFSPDGTNWDSTLTHVVTPGINEFHIPVKGPRHFRVRLVNGDDAQTFLRLYTYYGDFRQGAAPANLAIGLDADTLAVRPLDFFQLAAQGLYSGVSNRLKFGRNSDISSTGEDIWEGGGTYTGFNATANESLEFFSSDVDDQGALLESGTATAGSATTLTDSSATFVTNSVAAGDLLINDTQGCHGYITSVDSETQVTVRRMFRSPGGAAFTNAVGDSYRVANANDTGAAVVQASTPLDANFDEQAPVYAILNGTTGVPRTATVMRCSRGRIVLAGSSGGNEGTITCRQATTTANIFFAMQAGKNRTEVCADTVPNNEFTYIYGATIAGARSNGSVIGNFSLRIRSEPGAVFEEAWTLTAGNGVRANEALKMPLRLSGGTDFKMRCEDASANSGDFTAHMQYVNIEG